MQIVDPKTGQPMGGPSQQPGQSAGGSADASQFIVDVDMSNFQQIVLEGSMHIPVVLQSWSPQSASCKTLMSALEKLAHEYQGTIVLARLNIDEQQKIAAQLGIRAVPDVKMIIQGQLHDQLHEALPERQLREWLGKHVTAPEGGSESLEEQAQKALEAGDTAIARAMFEQLISENPDDHSYRIDMAGVMTREGNFDDALSILDALPPEHRDGVKARGVRARIDFAREALSPEDVEAMAERDDSEAQFQRALRAVADGDYERGLEGLLELMKRDRSYGEDAARKTLLRVFDALGGDHPLTVAYRRRMFTLLY
ncbi:tetratricopeptide repeat protein [Kushneria phyllosphaerae]|uniref:Thioredoxin C-1 n=1 Tax=Kushneria phyllosphaerae TaxID=2100822 RepID=A0A2R8CMF7_9GAMM|nr:tetratricopeptide repeat protein [Kushneria phyllosphaerae]SPJ34087.1 Thioredoxin C-1 [Kushneria phyllosphaerae]